MALNLTTTEMKAPQPKQIELLDERGYVKKNFKGNAIIDSDGNAVINGVIYPDVIKQK